MNSYILLRNNKESSSLSLEALQQLDIKPNDLIWVECQSVSWRHPHEIQELKGLVGENIQPAIIKDIPATVEEITIVQNITEKKAEKKSVLQELLAEVRSANQPDDVVPFEDLDSTGMYKYAGISKPVTIKNEKSLVNDSFINNDKWPVDEVKETPVRNIKAAAPPFSLAAIQLPAEMKKIAVYAALILSGALAMLFIKNATGKKLVAVQQTIPLPVNNTIAEEISIPENEEVMTAAAPVQEAPAMQNFANNPITNAPTEKNETTVKQNAKAIEKGNKDAKKPVDIKEDAEPVSAPVAEVKETKAEPVENISSKLVLKANDYGMGSFGGIKNLEITLQNNSKYLLDKVTAEIRYLNPEGAVVMTDNISFQSVHPGETETLPVTKTKRGVKITYKVIKIESKEINGSTAGL